MEMVKFVTGTILSGGKPGKKWPELRLSGIFGVSVKTHDYFSQVPTVNSYRYIELNPVRARLVQDPAAYIWSSYRSNAFGQSLQMWSPHKAYLALGCPKFDVTL